MDPSPSSLSSVAVIRGPSGGLRGDQRPSQAQGRYLNGPSEVGLGDAQPEHACDGHANTQPGEEAEEVDDGEDVLRDGVHHGQETLGRREKDDSLTRAKNPRFIATRCSRFLQ